MSHIQFPYRGKNTRRQHSSSDNGDFVTGASHNSIEREQAVHGPDPTGTEAGEDRAASGSEGRDEIGRASCRERV